jgi:hypothetical protein
MMGLRAYNKRGEQVVERMAWLRDGLAKSGEAPDGEAAVWLEEGEEIARLLAGMVHREIDPRTVDERAISRWQAEGRAAEREERRRQAQFGHAIRKSDKGQEEILRAFGTGELDPKQVMENVERGEADPFGTDQP